MLNSNKYYDIEFWSVIVFRGVVIHTVHDIANGTGDMMEWLVWSIRDSSNGFWDMDSDFLWFPFFIMRYFKDDSEMVISSESNLASICFSCVEFIYIPVMRESLFYFLRKFNNWVHMYSIG